MIAAIARMFERLSGRAQRRGMVLLMEHLTPTQREQFARRRYFDVIGGDTGIHYRIRNTRPMNVDVIRHGRCINRLCFEPEGELVLGDMLLAQKLALELYETQTLARANYIP